MKLSILIPALTFRNSTVLFNSLGEQIRHCSYDVEVLTESDSGELTSGQKRNKLMNRAKGEYICFIDDDDQIGTDYVDSILATIDNRKTDVITFNLQFVRDQKPREIWKFGLWPNNRRRGKMCANHLCVWKKSIADKVAWCDELGNWDDHLWFEPVYYAGLAKSIQHIPKVLYLYQYSGSITQNQTRASVKRAKSYIGKQGIRCYYKEDNIENTIMIEVGGKERYSDSSNVFVRDRYNTTHMIDPRQYHLFHTIYYR